VCETHATHPRVLIRAAVVPSDFADAVIMNFPMNHLSDSEALLAVKEASPPPPSPPTAMQFIIRVPQR
jgi:hypothetical protein